MDLQCGSRVRRGRPPSASLASKILEGLSSDSPIKCPECNRKFPRYKSLQAHRRIHTGETPYECNYPDCNSAFKQSGHLRSHMYRHTGEKPYGCPMEGCDARFIHSNRKCPTHASLKLVRDGKEMIRSDIENISESEIHWLQRYKEKKIKKSTGSSSPKEHNTSRKRSFSSIDCSEESSDRDSSRNSLSPVPVTNSETSGYCSFSGSEVSSSPVHYEVHEKTDSEYFAVSSKRKKSNAVIDIEDIKAAQILMQIKSGGLMEFQKISRSSSDRF